MDAAWDWGADLTDGLGLTHWTAYGLRAVGLIFSAAAAAACAGFSLNVLEPPLCFSFPWKCGKVNMGLREEFASFCKNPRRKGTLPVPTTSLIDGSFSSAQVNEACSKLKRFLNLEILA